MKAVALNYTTVELEPQESPHIQADATESPPTPPQHRHPDQKKPSEASRTAAYPDPDVSGILISQGCRGKEKG